MSRANTVTTAAGVCDTTQQCVSADLAWEARRSLGLPGIEDGAPADLLALPGDPRKDPSGMAVLDLGPNLA